MSELKIIPCVKKIDVSHVPSSVEKFDLSSISIPYAKKLTLDGKITCILDESLPSEGYKLSIKPSNIVITHSDNNGILYALATLRQIFDQSDRLYSLEIEDEPDFPLRGYMLDISRGKVPTLDTIKQIADNLVMLKMNHLELYIEGFSFAYPTFRKYWEDRTPITPEEVRELDAYCKERGIDLTPNQNSLGHMGDWLKTDEYKHLAIGIMKQTANPQNPETIELVAKMCDDLLPNFSSENFNVCLDEPFGLDSIAKKGLTVKDMYLDYTLKMHEICKFFGKKMMMWGDIVIKHPELVSKLPDDVTVLEWGYTANHPFDNHCEKYQKSGKDFIVCPGTSTWMGFCQKTDVSMTNIRNAVSAGKKYGAKGLLLTDWGDMGHVQYLPFTYVPLSLAASLTWNGSHSDLENMLSFINRYFYLDESDSLAQIIYTIGEYTKYEVEKDEDNRTQAFVSYAAGINHKKIFDPIAELSGNILGKTVIRFNVDRVLRHMAMCHEALKDVDPVSNESKLVVKEVENAITQISVGALLRDYVDKEKTLSNEARLNYLENIDVLIEETRKIHGEVWSARNKSVDCYGFYDKTAARTIKKIKTWIKQLKKNSPSYYIGLYVGAPIAGFFLSAIKNVARKALLKAIGQD